MSCFAFLKLLAGLLQLTVPSYGLRLVRRFGVQRVGWFLVLAFSSFALLQLLKPSRPLSAIPSTALTVDLACMLASILLLIGMGHLEALCATREQAENKERESQARTALAVQEQTAELQAAKAEALQEIERLRQREKILRESETQYRQLFTDNPQPMCIIELRTGRFLAVNQAVLRLFGYSREEFLNLAPRDLMAATAAATFLQDLAQPCFRAESRGPWPCFTKSLTLLDAEITALDLRFADCPARLMLLEDVTQRRRQQTEDWHKAKMELASQISGGMAHHFSNLLTVIQGHSEILLQKEAQNLSNMEPLKQISAASARAAALTRQLLTISGCDAQLAEPVELSAFLRTLTPMLRQLVGEGIALQTVLPAHLSPVFAAPTLLEHILVQLVTNAREAMPEGGKLTLTVEAVRFEAEEPRLSQAAQASNFVRLTARDTGCGMSPEVQAHLFEPFFTTRDLGQAPGLGLASVYGAVKQLAGWLEFSSAPGVGTEFRLFFPCATAEQLRAASGKAKATPPSC